MKRMSSAAADALTFGGFGDDSPSRELNAVVSGELSPQRKRKVFSDYASPRRKKKIKATDGPRKSGVRTSSPGKGVGGWEDGTRGNGAQMEDLPPRRGGFSPRRREEVSNLEDLTPPRRRKQGSPVHDLSPLRKRKDDGHTEDLSPPRQKKGSSPEEDLSPPRRRPVTVSPRRRKESSGVEDLSSGRRRRESMAVGDLSPPRRNENRALEDISPPRRRRDNNIVQNISPSRRRKERGTLEGLSPPRRSHGDGQFKDRKDLSPPRRNLENRSPPRRSYGDGQFKDRKDLSPPRRNLEDRSPPRRNHGDGQLKDRKDLSPPRRTLNDRSSPRRNHGDGQFKDRKDFSPPRRILDDRSSPRRNHGDGQFKDRKDLSPPRKTLEDRSLPRRNHGDGQLKDRKDSSPPRRTLEALSPPRRSHGHGDGRFKDRKDLSPPRRTLEDLSPSRRSQGDGQFKDRKGLSPARRSHDDGQFQDRRQLNRRDEHLGSRTLDRHEDVDDTKKRMLDGAATGLRTDKEIKVDIERKRNAELRGLAAMDASQSGRGAETIYRDRRGKRLEGLEELLRQQEGLKKPEAKPLEWGKGLVQKREADIKQQELEAEASKPFARSRDDPELDKSLREKIRWGDPMAHLVKPPEPELEDIGARENMKESGFSIPQDMPMHSWIKRKIGPPPNRYGIKPGRHWDGVDRSNGFEQKMFKQQNEKRARDQEAYAWSVADM